MKKVILLALCGLSLVSCKQHKVMLVCREDFTSSGCKGMQTILRDGWRYEGLICNNGINCQYVLFSRFGFVSDDSLYYGSFGNYETDAPAVAPVSSY